MQQKYHALCEICKGILKHIDSTTQQSNSLHYSLHYECDKCSKSYEYTLRKGPPYIIHKSFYLSNEQNYKCLTTCSFTLSEPIL